MRSNKITKQKNKKGNKKYKRTLKYMKHYSGGGQPKSKSFKVKAGPTGTMKTQPGAAAAKFRAAGQAVVATQKFTKAQLTKQQKDAELKEQYKFISNAPNNVQKILLGQRKNSTLLDALQDLKPEERKDKLKSQEKLLEFSKDLKTKLPELTKEQRRQKLIRLAQNKKLSNNNISKLDALQNTSSIGLATKILSKTDYNRSKFNLVELSLRDKLLQSKSITSANKRKIRGLRNAGQIKNFVNKSSNPKLDEIKNNLRTFLNTN
jgi:vacuolar-type H+-ATPase subunit I/STV1